MSEGPAGAKLLVVDDEESVRSLICRILSDSGYDVESAVDGKDALQKIAKRRPDLIVLDLMMPELDGWGVVDALRKAGDPPPVLMLTARSDYDTFARAVREGVTAFISKPFRLQELLSATRKILEQAWRPPEPVANERRRERRRALLARSRCSRARARRSRWGSSSTSAPAARSSTSTRRCRRGERIRIAFHTPGAAGPLNLDCEVLWWRGSASRRVGHGLVFRNLLPADVKHLEELLGLAPPPA
jgi:DNA-binding response OmpR family regulator